MQPHSETRSVRVAAFAVTVAIAVALAALAWRGWYTRYIRDDFCTAATTIRHGVVAALTEPYLTWSGRFSYYPIKALLELIGDETARIVPAALIVAFAATALLTVRRILQPESLPLAMLFALVLVFAAYDATPILLGLGGPLVWETGAITYNLPVILFTLWLGFLDGRGSLRARCAASAALMFVAGGLSETSLAAQAALTGGACVLALLLRARDRAWIAASGVVATVAALVIVAAAPGNIERMSAPSVPPQHSLVTAVLRAIEFSYYYIGSYAMFEGAALLLVIATGLVAGGLIPRFRPAIAIGFGVVAIGAYVVSFVPAAWMLSASPPDRALHVTNYFLVLALGAFSVAAGRAIAASRPPFVPAAAKVLLVLSFIPVAATLETIDTIPDARRTAAEIDRITGIFERSAGRHVVIRSHWAEATKFMGPKPTDWENVCLCRYYGTRSARLIP